MVRDGEPLMLSSRVDHWDVEELMKDLQEAHEKVFIQQRVKHLLRQLRDKAGVLALCEDLVLVILPFKGKVGLNASLELVIDVLIVVESF